MCFWNEDHQCRVGLTKIERNVAYAEKEDIPPVRRIRLNSTVDQCDCNLDFHHIYYGRVYHSEEISIDREVTLDEVVMQRYSSARISHYLQDDLEGPENLLTVAC